jgi:hypothetical protein
MHQVRLVPAAAAAFVQCAGVHIAPQHASARSACCCYCTRVRHRLFHNHHMYGRVVRYYTQVLLTIM